MTNKVQRTEPSQFLHTHPGTSFLERNSNLSRVVLTFLETRDILRVAKCSSHLQKQAEAPRLWQIVSHTLQLPDALWKDRSKADVQYNLENIKKVNRIFVFCCRKDAPKGPDGETLRQKILKFAKVPEERLDAALPLENPRACFLTHVRPVVLAMCQPPESSAALHEMLMCNEELATQILTLFYASGHRGSPKTLNYMSGYPLYCPKLRDDPATPGLAVFKAAYLRNPSVIHTHNNLAMMTEFARKSDATLSMEALRVLLKYGELPETFMPLLGEYDVRPSAELARIIAYLIEKGSTPEHLKLFQFLWCGPMEYVKFFIEKTNIEVSPTDLSLFLYMLVRAFQKQPIPEQWGTPFGWNQIVNILDLMKARQADVHDYHETEERFTDNFGRIMLYNPPRYVLEKMIAVGIRPLNNPEPRLNSIAFALAGSLSYEKIALMKELGALPPNNYAEIVAAKYAGKPEIQAQLLKLFA